MSAPDARGKVPHPMQPLADDGKGVLRFKQNAIVRFLLDDGPFDMNRLAELSFTVEDREQFAQLIGYSLSGFGELSYVRDKTYDRAALAAAVPAGPEELEPDGRERIACGHTHPHSQMEARFVAVREEVGAPQDGAGCGRSAPWTFMFRCVECGRWFHRECIRRHFANHAPAPGGPEEREAKLSRTWEAAAQECEDGAVGSGHLFEWDGKLYALGESGVAALRFMAAQFRENAIPPRGSVPGGSPTRERE